MHKKYDLLLRCITKVCVKNCIKMTGDSLIIITVKRKGRLRATHEMVGWSKKQQGPHKNTVTPSGLYIMCYDVVQDFVQLHMNTYLSILHLRKCNDQVHTDHKSFLSHQAYMDTGLL